MFFVLGCFFDLKLESVATVNVNHRVSSQIIPNRTNKITKKVRRKRLKKTKKFRLLFLYSAGKCKKPDVVKLC